MHLIALASPPPCGGLEGAYKGERREGLLGRSLLCPVSLPSPAVVAKGGNNRWGKAGGKLGGFQECQRLRRPPKDLSSASDKSSFPWFISFLPFFSCLLQLWDLRHSANRCYPVDPSPPSFTPAPLEVVDSRKDGVCVCKSHTWTSLGKTGSHQSAD